jgi:hypothetical protein
MNLNPARVKVAVGSNRRGFGGFFSDPPKWEQLISDSPKLNIKKPDGNFDVVGSYSLDDSVDIKEVKANKPVNLKIELKGEGSLDDYEGIEFDLAGVTIYSDDAKVDSKLLRDEFHSRYKKQFVFISDHDFIVPSKTIRAYNYKTGEIDELKTKEYHIKVKGVSKKLIAPTVYSKSNIDNHSNSSSSENPTHNIKWNVPPWFMLLGAFVLGIITTIVGWNIPSTFSKIIFKKFRIGVDEALAVLYPHMSKGAEVEEMVRKLYDKKQGEKVEIDTKLLKSLLEKYREMPKI